MADKAIYEMISAFASGCMDSENYKYFRNYLLSDGEMPKGELGELQNVISLVPSILETETPNPELKEKVAKKLISLQDEIKLKIKEKKTKLLLTLKEVQKVKVHIHMGAKVHLIKNDILGKVLDIIL